MSETSIIPREMPKWACLSVIGFSFVAIGVQGAIDVYQGARNTVFPSIEWLLQAYTMSLPTMGAVAFSLFCGWLLNIGYKTLAGMIFVLAAGFMVVTTSNGWDFMAAQTIGKSEAARLSAQVAKEATDINNDLTLKERTRTTDELWRTYTTTNNAERKKEAFDKIREMTQAPLALQTAPVEVTSTGSGAIFHQRLGWRPEAIQELRALGLPALIMVAKMFGLTLGFGFWPRNTSGGLNQPSEDRKLPKIRKLPDLRPKTTEREAYEDLKRMLAAGVEVKSQAFLARRWGVSEPTAHAWLGKWGAVKEPASFGRRNQITSLNGNGRLLTQ